MPELKLKLTAGTNVGLVRSNNEDNFVVCRNLIHDDWTIPQAGETTDLGPYGALLVVADGMGGANAGEVASSLAIETVQKTFSNKRLSSVIKSEEKILKFLCTIMHDADSVIGKHSKKNKDTRGMGTTLVIVWLLNDKAYICWCGDSRCYVFNPAVGLTRLSKDHSFVQLLVDKGELSPENVHNHPMSNVITQCLGTATHNVNPDTRVYPLAHNDVLLLCTDGLCGLCSDDEIVKVMADCDDVSALKGRLIEAALSAGGHDNVTVVLCQVDSPSLMQSEKRGADISATINDAAEPDSADQPTDTASESTLSEENDKPEPEHTPDESAEPAEPAELVESAESSESVESEDSAEPAAAEEGETDTAKPEQSHPRKRSGKKVALILLAILVITAIVTAVAYRSEIQQQILDWLNENGDTVFQKLRTLLRRNK